MHGQHSLVIKPADFTGIATVRRCLITDFALPVVFGLVFLVFRPRVLLPARLR
tara:strand:- start:624 stop:782 length:159 start_codon:yes stop_codon:yes gene_type:complete